LGTSKRVFFCTETSRPSLGPTQPPGYFPGTKAAGTVMLTTHLHLAPHLRINGDILLLHLYAFMVWTERTIVSDHIPNIVEDIFIYFIYFNEYHIAGVMIKSPDDELIQFETC
jgi:hypothetical protein